MSEVMYNLEITAPNFSVKETGITKKAAEKILDKLKVYHKDNQELIEKINFVTKDFGFVSSCGNGYNVSISAYKEAVKTGEKQTCGRRTNDWGVRDRSEMEDEWIMRGNDKVCSYCGSLHPERVIELIKEYGFGIIETTTKDYKLYVTRKDVPNASHGGIKYYLQHNTPEFVQQYNELVTIHNNK